MSPHCAGSGDSGHFTAYGTLQCVACGAEFIGEDITPDHDTPFTNPEETTE